MKTSTLVAIATAAATFTAALSAQAQTVNAPVAPEAIYVGFDAGSGAGGISVIDLNGFGQGTGDRSRSNFSRNPNIGAPLLPPLRPGTSNLDAGGAGPFTLTEDTTGNTNLIANRSLGTIRDIHIGHPLDKVFNNFAINQNAGGPNQVNPFSGVPTDGNTISIAPHPNPPRLVVPSPNPLAGIDADEPTVTSSVGPSTAITTGNPPCVASPINLLRSGGLGGAMPGVFYGPQPPPGSPPPPPPFCPFTSRQQIGHFLYALEESAGSIVVFNSNRFRQLTVLSGLGYSDIALAPNLRWLAAVRDTPSVVDIYDIDPRSPNFHQLIVQQSQQAPPS